MADTVLKRWNPDLNEGSGGWEELNPQTTHTQIVASGTPSSTTFLRGDGTWSTPEGGVSKSDLQNVYVYGKASVAITKGQAVQFAGAQGDHALIKPAVPSEINAEPTLMIGIAETDLAVNDFGYVIVNGRLNLDTSVYAAGDILYFDSSVADTTTGALTTTEPTDPKASIQLAAVSIDGVGNGELLVRTTILTRTIDEVTGLQTSLDSKVNKAGDTITGTLEFTTSDTPIKLQEDHFVYRKFDPTTEAVVNSNTAYILLCRNAGGNDVNGTITMDRTSGLRHASTVDILISAGSSATPVGTMRSMATAGSAGVIYKLVTLTYSGNSFVALYIYNPDSYYDTSGMYFTGRIKTTDTANEFKMLYPADVSDVADFGVNESHQINGERVFADDYHPNADKWTTARTLTVGGTGKTVDGSGNVSWSLAEIGAAAASHTHAYIPTSEKGAASGVATLDANGKLTNTQIPDYLVGGLKFVGALDLSANTTDLQDLATALGTMPDLDNSFAGSYWIVSAAGGINAASGFEWQEDGAATPTVLVWDDGVQATNNTTDVNLEVGDWVIVTNYVYGGTVSFGVINNNDPRFASYVAKSGDTMTGNLTIGANTIYGNSTGRYLSLNNNPVLSSVANIEIRADDDDSSNTEYVRLMAGQNTLQVTSSQTGTDQTKLTYNGNQVLTSVTGAKRIDLTSQVQLASYRKSVIALCNLDNSEISRNSWSGGTIYFHRTNGLSAPVTLQIAMEKRYNSVGANYTALVMSGDSFGDNIQYIKFQKDGVWYGGIEFHFSAAEHSQVYFIGETNFNIFGLDYYNTQTSSAINTEVNNSITGSDMTAEQDFFFNGQTIWHSGNAADADGKVSKSGDTMTGDLTISSTYPRINLTDTNHNSDYSIINNDGSLGFYDNTNSAYRMHILAGGNVGIGTTSPSEKLTVAGSFVAGGFTATDTDQWPNFYWLRGVTGWDEGLIKGSSARGVFGKAHFGIHFDDDRSFAFHTSGWDTEMEINGDGTTYMKGPVGIGTASPASKLQINGADADGWNRNIGMSVDGTEIGKIVVDNQGIKYRTMVSGDHHHFRNSANSTTLIVQDDGKVGIGTTSPGSNLEVAGSWKLDGITGAFFSNYSFGTELNLSELSSGGWARANRIRTADTSGTVFFGVLGVDTTLAKAYWTIGNPATVDATGYNTANGITLLKNGNVGIGTTSPSALLTVGNISGGAGYDTGSKVLVGGGLTIQSGQWLSYDHGYSVHARARYNGALTERSFQIEGYYGHSFTTRDGDAKMVIMGNTGNVGIGTTSPGSKLQVNGQVRWGADGTGGYSGNPRAAVIGYSGGNYGNIGYGWVPTSSSGNYTSAISDLQSRVMLYDGIVVYGSGSAVSVGSTVSFQEVLDARTSRFTYKGNNIWHGGNLSFSVSNGVLTITTS